LNTTSGGREYERRPSGPTPNAPGDERAAGTPIAALRQRDFSIYWSRSVLSLVGEPIHYGRHRVADSRTDQPAATRRDSGQGHERERHVYDPERTIAGWITLATIFIREFSILLFLYSPGSEPLGPLLYFYYLYGAYGRIATVGLVILLTCTILIAFAQRFSDWEE
jgi:hypothetical protein